MDGLMTGTIKSGSDKEHPGMLEVSIPDTKNKTASTCWAQVLTPICVKLKTKEPIEHERAFSLGRNILQYFKEIARGVDKL